MLLASIFRLLFLLISLFSWAIILSAVFSMLFAFGVLDTRNRLVWSIGNFLNRLTDPVLAPVRRVLPLFGNIDLSPLVVLLLLQYVVSPLLAELEMRIAMTGFDAGGS
ncbi:YggT family protein [Lichenicoccus sp.]|uniref:YggT family protein n=1 Tax=Lichenicoccus sp. TaxID=2781899 RepID=UPI003D0A7BC9